MKSVSFRALAALLPVSMAVQGVQATTTRATAAAVASATISAAPAPVPAPASVALAFYRAYVARFRSDHDPLLDLVLQGSPMVSTSLLASLRTHLDDDAELDDDHFLHAPHGVRPCHSVDVETLHATADEAAVRVTLAARRTPPWSLAVTLGKESGAWRIVGVERGQVAPTRRAAARAMSDC